MLLLAAAFFAGCGGDDERLRVYAASSLREAFPAIDDSPRYSFGGSNQLQLQIERGAPADVFASASPKEATALHRAGRCGRPVRFATNRLALIVPTRGAVDSVSDLRRGRLRLAIGARGVPIGDYTRAALRGLDLGDHVVSSEPNVAAIVSKVALGSADAGFAYVTDAQGDRVRAIPVASPPIAYLICAVRRTPEARELITRVRGPDGRRVLAAKGFGVP